MGGGPEPLHSPPSVVSLFGETPPPRFTGEDERGLRHRNLSPSHAAHGPPSSPRPGEEFLGSARPAGRCLQGGEGD